MIFKQAVLSLAHHMEKKLPKWTGSFSKKLEKFYFLKLYCAREG